MSKYVGDRHDHYPEILRLRAELAELKKEMKLVKTWYRSLTSDGKLWCETSDQTDSYLLNENEPVTFQRLEIYESDTGWQPWTPTIRIRKREV